jgi:hypothetical protein
MMAPDSWVVKPTRQAADESLLRSSLFPENFLGVLLGDCQNNGGSDLGLTRRA